MVNFFQIIFNYCFIQIAILLFFTPFYGSYVIRKQIPFGKELFANELIASFFTSNEGNALVFCWAALEALNWFVIPEFLLLLIIFMRIKKKLSLLYFDIGGTICGTIIAVIFAQSIPIHLLSIPYIHAPMVQQVIAWYTYLGIWGLLFQPFSGIPYKVFTLTAYQFHFSLIPFLTVAILVRLSRYYLFYCLFSFLYPVFHIIVYKRYIVLFFCACFIFSLALIHVSDYYGSDYQVSIITFQKIAKYFIFLRVQ